MNKIILYSQPNCPQCRMAHMLLDNKKISYEECQDVEIMKSKGINHTPTIYTGIELEEGPELLTGKAMFDFIKEYRG